MPAVGISGIREIEAGLASLRDEAKAVLPGIVARKLASLAVQAFRRPELRPTPWPPLAASTLARAGAGGNAARKSRESAKAWREKAAAASAKAEGLSGKKRDKALAAASKARAKAKEWSGKAKAAKAAAAAGKTMLRDTGNMQNSILAQGASVVVSAKAGKEGKEYPYPLVHQYGSKNVPARPFIPVLPDGSFPPAAEKEIRAGIGGELDRMVRRRNG